MRMKKKLPTWHKEDLKLKLNIQHFAESEEDAPKDDPAKNEEQPTNEDKPTDEDKSTELTQEELNQIAEASLLKSLGVESLKDAKAKLDSWKEYEDSKKTEQDKINDRIAKLEEEKTGKDDTIFGLQAQLAASKQSVPADSIDDVITLAKAQMTDDVTIEDAIKSVVEKYPQFKGETTERPSGVFTDTKPGRVSSSADDAFEAINAKYKSK